MPDKLFPCSIVGSYSQPDWLVYKERLAIKDMEEAGLDIITDGEIRRESYSNRFATALNGVDIDNPGQAQNDYYATDADCGLKYIPRENAYKKLKNMCEAARILRGKHG